MRITFRLTYEDFQEALKAHTKATKKPAGEMAGSLPPPNGVLFISNAKPNASRGRFGCSFLTWVLIAIIFASLFLTFVLDIAPSSVLPPSLTLSLSEKIRNIIPWLFIALVLWFFFIRQFLIGKRSKEKLNEDPGWSQERVLELVENGVRVSAPTERHEFDWLGFTHVAETDNLFLLYQYPLFFQIVPKRAFTSLQDMDEFRRIIGEKIGDRRTKAFPVEPAKS